MIKINNSNIDEYNRLDYKDIILCINCNEIDMNNISIKEIEKIKNKLIFDKINDNLNTYGEKCLLIIEDVLNIRNRKLKLKKLEEYAKDR